MFVVALHAEHEADTLTMAYLTPDAGQVYVSVDPVTRDCDSDVAVDVPIKPVAMMFP